MDPGSDGGDPDWLAAPAQMLVGLLLQAVDEPPELVVPELRERSWDVFVSTPGKGVGFTGTAIRDSLLSDHHLSVWYMGDQERIGRDITENATEGIRRSGVVLVVLHESYWASKYCVAEFLEAVRCERPLVPIVVTASGDPEEVEAQRALIRASLQEHRGAYSPDVVERAADAADRLLGDTIRVAVREGETSLPAAKLSVVAQRVHDLQGERARSPAMGSSSWAS